MVVLTRDWYHEPQAVLDRIERALRGDLDAVDEPPVELPEPLAIELQIAATPPPTSLTVPTTMPTAGRRCEFVEGTAAKFWEILRQGTMITIRYGRIGTQGQTLTKSFDTDERAERELEKLLGEKLRKGYREVT
jgi:predicted DNA-binding WGR domain protein